ncbi:MAG: tRNA epoxyqueuosine(34) reductase QueG [Muribaculaceae bacterium]|nr:tRNA epoxyqueuosine(34) reductase QueG [Muribaculaceae bacterium]
MNSCPYKCDADAVRRLAADAGATACGIAAAGPVGAEAVEQYRRWISAGRHAAMDYMERHGALRDDPRELFPGTRSVIVCAFNYYTDEPVALPVALYARGMDYHYVLRQRLESMASRLCGEYGGEARVCVDSAPLRERWWAVRAGLGFIGLNNQLIIPGRGSYFVLGVILWTGVAQTTPPLQGGDCGRCGRCVAACPAGALDSGGAALDARRCLSYLTIEHRGDFPPGTDLCGHLFGCDECQRVCPHNRNAAPSEIAEFHPSDEFAALGPDDVAALTSGAFKRMFRSSPIFRCRPAGLGRNLKMLYDISK